MGRQFERNEIDKMKHIKTYIFLATGFEEIEAISVVDILRRADIKVETISISGNLSVIGAHNIEISADALFDKTDFSDGDMLILPGGQPGTNNLNACEKLKKLIQNYYDQNKYIAAICAAPLIFGEMGLLKYKKAVCYPGYENQLLGAEIAENERVVVSDNIITSKGAGTAIEFSLKLVEILVGKETAEILSKKMIVK